MPPSGQGEEMACLSPCGQTHCSEALMSLLYARNKTQERNAKHCNAITVNRCGEATLGPIRY